MAMASGVAASLPSADRQLATALVVARGDVPGSWGTWPLGVLPSCLTDPQGVTVTSRARAGLGTPNSGVSSFATVLKNPREADRYYRAALAETPRCARDFVATERTSHVSEPQLLTLGRYGARSSEWRLRFRGRDGSRHAFDWAVVAVGRGVLVELFQLGIYDDRWKDISATHGLGGSSLGIETKILRNATRRAAATL